LIFGVTRETSQRPSALQQPAADPDHDSIRFQIVLFFFHERHVSRKFYRILLTENNVVDRNQSTFHIILLIVLCGALYFPYLDSTPFFDKGEPREAMAVQDIVQR